MKHFSILLTVVAIVACFMLPVQAQPIVPLPIVADDADLGVGVEREPGGIEDLAARGQNLFAADHLEDEVVGHVDLREGPLSTPGPDPRPRASRHDSNHRQRPSGPSATARARPG